MGMHPDDQDDPRPPQNVTEFMHTSSLVFFQPNEKFWAFMEQLPWKHKQFHDIGAGAGCLTRQMRDKGFDVKAYDLYSKRHPCVPDIEILDVTKDWLTVEVLDCLLIARPCHSGFVAQVLKRYLDVGDALYISKAENVSTDIGEFHYEIVAYDVGRDGENVYRIWAHHETAKTFCLLTGGQAGWWEYDVHRNKFLNASGLGGFRRSENDVVVKEQKAQHCDLFYTAYDTSEDASPIGWLAKDGTFYGCGYGGHSALARVVLGTSEKRLERSGWVKLQGPYQGGMLYHVGYGGGFGKNDDEVVHTLTAAQVRVMKIKGYKAEAYDLPVSDPNYPLGSEPAPTLIVPTEHTLRGNRVGSDLTTEVV